MTKLWHECITCLKMKKYSKGIMENICKKCLENQESILIVAENFYKSIKKND